MNWKQFLNLRIIAMTIVLTFITYVYSSSYASMSANFVFYGLPFPYYECQTGYFPIGESTTNCGFHVGPDEFPYLWLVIDVLFWYLVSLFIIWVYNRVKKK